MRRPALLVWSSETQAALQKKHVHLFCCPFSVVAAEFMVSFRKAETVFTVVYTGWNLRESDTIKTAFDYCGYPPEPYLMKTAISVALSFLPGSRYRIIDQISCG